MHVVRSEVAAELLSEQRVSTLVGGQEDASACRPALLRILAWRPTSGRELPTRKVSDVKVDADGDVDVPRRRKRQRRSQSSDEEDSGDHREVLCVLETTLAGDVAATGTQVWRGSFVMAEFIQSRDSEFRGMVVLELGCGVAALAVCERNVRRNCEEHGAVRVRYLDWEDESTPEPSGVEKQFRWAQEDHNTLQRGVDWIVASDVFYDDEVTDLFLDKLHRLLLQHSNARAVVSVEKRVVFSAVTLSEISLGYDAFRARLCPHETTSHTTHAVSTLSCSECAQDDHDHHPTTRFVATLIPVDLLPRVYQYERVSTLEVWELRAVCQT